MNTMAAALPGGGGLFGRMKVPVTIVALVGIIGGCFGGIIMNMQAMKFLHVKENLDVFSSDRISRVFQKRLGKLLWNPGRTNTAALIKTLESGGYRLSYDPDTGNLRRFSMPIDQHDLARMQPFLSELRGQYHGSVIYENVSNQFTTQPRIASGGQARLTIDYSKMNANYRELSQLRAFREIERYKSRKIMNVYYGGSRGVSKIVKKLRYTPVRLWNNSSNPLAGRSIQDQIAKGRLDQNFQRTVTDPMRQYRAMFSGAARAKMFNALPEGLIRRMPVAVLQLLAPKENPEALRQFFKRITVDSRYKYTLRKTFNTQVRGRGVFRITSSLLLDLAKVIAPRFLKVAVKAAEKIVSPILTRVGSIAAGVASSWAGIGLVLLAMSTLSLACDVGELVSGGFNLFGGLYQSAVHDQIAQLYHTFGADVEQSLREGFSEYQAKFYHQIFSDNLSGQLWGDASRGGLAAGLVSTASADSYRNRLADLANPDQEKALENLSPVIVGSLSAISGIRESPVTSVGCDIVQTPENLLSAALGWAFSFTPDWLQEATAEALGNVLSWGMSSLTTPYINYLTENPPIDVEKIFAENPALVGDLIAIGSVYSTNAILEDAGGYELSPREADRQMLDNYLARVEFGEDTSSYDAVYASKSPSFWAKVIASPAHAQKIPAVASSLMALGIPWYGIDDHRLENPDTCFDDGGNLISGDDPDRCTTVGNLSTESDGTPAPGGDNVFPFFLSELPDKGFVEDVFENRYLLPDENTYFSPDEPTLGMPILSAGDDIEGEFFGYVGGSLASHANLDPGLASLFREAGSLNGIPAAVLASIAKYANGGTLPTIESSLGDSGGCTVGIMKISRCAPEAPPNDQWGAVSEKALSQSGHLLSDSAFESGTDLATLPHVNIFAAAIWLNDNRAGTAYERKNSDQLWSAEEVHAAFITYFMRSPQEISKADSFALYENLFDPGDPSGILLYSRTASAIANQAMAFASPMRPESLAGSGLKDSSITLVEDRELCYFVHGNSCLSSPPPAWCIEFVYRVLIDAVGERPATYYRNSPAAYRERTTSGSFTYLPAHESLALLPGDALVLLSSRWVNPEVKHPSGHGSILISAERAADGVFRIQTVDGNMGNKTGFFTWNLTRSDNYYRIQTAGGTTFYLAGVWRYANQQSGAPPF